MKIIIKKLLYFAFAIPILLQAQSSVSGNVTDVGADLPLPGVNISIEGTSRGTVTDFNGEFTIEPISKGQILKFEYLGFKTKLVTFSGQETLDVKLEEDISQLNEVVLIGYGSSKKQDVTGAVDNISEKEFNQGAIVSPEQLLSGKTPGVRVTTAGGAPGAGSQIRIRGGSSLTGNNDPLIVVDGIPLDQRGVQGVRNQLNAINPNDIKDFVVLKDAASTAIYGSRASNGVILITTKKGLKNSPLSVEIDSKVSMSRVTKTVDVLNGDQFRAIVNERGTDEQKSLIGSESNTNWQDQIFQEAIGSITNISLSKGFKSTTLRGSFNHTDQSGVLKTDTYNKNALNFNATQDLLGGDLKLTLTTKFINDKNRFANNDAINNALRFDPTQPVLDATGNFTEGRASDGSLEVNAPANPLGTLLQDDNRASNKRNISNLTIDYKIPFVPGLSYNMNLGVDYSEVEGNQFKAPNIGQNKIDNRFIKNYSGTNRNQLLDLYFNYKKLVDPINTKVDLTAGYSYQEFFESRRRTETKNREDLDFFDVDRNLLISYFGRASFDIADKYLVSGSIRRDGSSRFAEDNRFGVFPGVSVGWKLQNENFLKNVDVIDELKIRAGWGVTGQQEISQNLGFLPVFTVSNSQARVQFGDEFVSTNRPQPFNTELKWEETINKNIGLDYSLFAGRLSGSIDVYEKDTKDLLAEVPLASGSNLVDRFVVNAAETESRGLEFAINGDIFQKENFNWNLAFNATFNERKITKLALSDDPDFQIPQGGISGGTGNNIQIWKPGFDPTTFLINRQIYNAEGKPIEGAYIDINGDNEITEEDRQPYKKATPDVFLGFTSTMNYKNLDFSFTLRSSLGGYNYNNVKSDVANIKSIIDTPGNYLQNAHSDVLNTNFRNQELFSDYYLESADFVRLDNISVGYNFDFDKMKLRLSLTGTNLFTITDYDGIDPEVYVTDILSQREGIDDRSYPRPRTFVLGMNLKF